MADYLKNFETTEDYNTYINGNDVLKPNVSYCEDNNEVHYNPIPPPETRVVAIFNVTDSSNPTQLYPYYDEEGWESEWVKGADFFDSIEIDGTEIPIQDIDVLQGKYQLTEGNHTLKYTLKDPTSIVEVNSNGAFSNCSSLTSVTIPNSVTSIGGSAFYECTSLTNIVIPNSVTSIGSGAFQDCNLTSVTIPNSITSIEQWTFAGCRSLTTLIIPNSVTSIGYGAFYGCSGLTSVTFGEKLTKIGDVAFQSCIGLVNLEIPSGVTSIGDYAFCGCPLNASVREQISAINSRALTCPWD